MITQDILCTMYTRSFVRSLIRAIAVNGGERVRGRETERKGARENINESF